jgi:hypothetical protein
LGTLDWEGNRTGVNSFEVYSRDPIDVKGTLTLISNKLITQPWADVADYGIRDDTLGYVYVKLPLSVASTVDAVKQWLQDNSVFVVYEKATPTEEDSTPFTNPQVTDPNGTEEYIDERAVAVPVGHETKYPEDLKGKLEELPALPTEAGTYKLKVTVSGGVVTRTWEAE